MFLFIQDNGWRGCIVVIANNEKDARDLMKDEENYDSELELNSYNLEEGFKFANLGDS